MAEARGFGFTATLLPTGNVFVAGGYREWDLGNLEEWTEVYSAASGGFSSGPTSCPGIMGGHVAAPLPGGAVLLAGGDKCSGGPTDNTLRCSFSGADAGCAAAGQMAHARFDHRAVALSDGRVLVAGGNDGGSSPRSTSAELYNPAGGWSSAAPMSEERASHTLTLLQSGKVLAAGGGGTEAELYDPAGNSWSPAGAMAHTHSSHTATLLNDGRVLVAGGSNEAELYDPIANSWSPAGANAGPSRLSHTATLLDDGRVLVAGGHNEGTHTATAELYDPASNSWSATTSMRSARSSHQAVRLANGRVLVIGGGDDRSLATTEIYDPAPDPPPPPPPPPPPCNPQYQACEPPPASPDDPGPVTREGCEGKVKVGVIVAQAECFKRKGQVLTAHGKVRINGIDLGPITPTEYDAAEGDGQFTLEIDLGKQTLKIAGTGLTVRVRATTIYSGSFSKTFDARKMMLELPVGKGTRFRGFPVGGTASFEFGDGTVSGHLNADLPAFLGAVTAEVSFSANTAKGVDLTSIRLKVEKSQMLLGNIISSDYLEVQYQWHESSEAPKAGIASAGRRGLARASAHGGVHTIWKGNFRMVMPTPPQTVMEGGMVFDNGEVTGASLIFDRLNLKLAEEIHLQRIRALFSKSPLRLAGGLGISFGPQVAFGPPGKQKYAEMLSLDGDLDLTFARNETEPTTMEAKGRIGVIELFDLVSAYTRYRTDYAQVDRATGAKTGTQASGVLEFGGLAKFPKEGDLGGFSLQGGFDGSIYGLRYMNLEGKVALDVPGEGELSAQALLSTKGLAACRTIYKSAKAGFYYLWDGDWDWFVKSCDLGHARAVPPGNLPFTSDEDGPFAIPSTQRSGNATASRTRRAAKSAQQIRVPKGLPIEAFSWVGRDAPPKVKLTGPGGIEISTPAGNESRRHGRYWIVQAPKTKTTYIAVGAPPPGNWTATLLPESSPVVSARTAEGLPKPAVRARVSGRGSKRVLSWRLRRIPGQTVRFAEKGRSSSAILATTKSRTGRVRFRPPTGLPGKRRIVALVEQDGLIRAKLPVASYNASRPARPGKPKRVRIKRKGSKFIVAWSPARHAQRYAVRARLGDGRRLLYLTKRRSVTIPVGVAKKVTVRVSAFSSPNRFWSARKASHPVPKKKTKKTRPKKRKRARQR